MSNKTVGKIGATITGFAILAVAISMIAGLFTDALFASCLASIFIAVGFIPFMAALFSQNKTTDRKAIGLTGIAFAAVYAVIVFLVYYAEITTVRMNPQLGEEALSIISYGGTVKNLAHFFKSPYSDHRYDHSSSRDTSR